MITKTAIIQCADTGPLESLVQMLQAVGYRCMIPSDTLKQELRRVFNGKGLVLDIASLVRGMGYDRPLPLPEASIENMGQKGTVYVDVKAHQIYSEVVNRWPSLENNVLWYRINGGQPEHVINARGDHGDEVGVPCPVITPNQWYSVDGINDFLFDPDKATRLADMSYCMWPPFVKMGDYATPRKDVKWSTSPVCLIHGFKGWGYNDLLPAMERLRVVIYGQASPGGLLRHSTIPEILNSTLAMVHLKSSDAPGYALYEAMAAKCPIICTRKLIWKCKMEELLIPNETCLVFDKETHAGFTAQDLVDCEHEVKDHLERLKDPGENRRIGEGGYNRLKQVMWDKDNPADLGSLLGFMAQHFGR